MKKSDIWLLWHGLNNMDKNLKTSIKFAYAVARTLDKIKDEVNSLSKVVEPSIEYQKYDSGRIEIAKKYAKKDENGQPLIDGQEFVFDPEGLKKFESEFIPDSNLIDERKKQLEEFVLLLQEPSESEVYKISLNDFPDEISLGNMEIMYHMVED
jgi:predicted CopG family antitoxin